MPEPSLTVVLGSRILMMTAAKRFGLYSAFRACKAIFFKSSLHPRLTVDTIFWKETDYQKKVVNVLFNGKLGRMKIRRPT